MEIRFHRRIQQDLDAILDRYHDVSTELADDFFAKFQSGLKRVERNPESCYFDRSGLRRCNLERFPYHFLYDLPKGYVRVWVLRYDRRQPGFGTRRFKR